MRYMIVEHFRNGAAAPIYARFSSRGRLAPAGLHYIDSWVTHDLTHAYQLMESESYELLEAWMAAWSDLVEFEVHPVMNTADAMVRALGAS